MGQNKTIALPPLHPKRLDHPLENALREAWEKLNLDILMGPTCHYNEIAEGTEYEICPLSGGVQPYPFGRMTARDRMVAAETIQWLGSNTGLAMLTRAFQRAGGNVEYSDHQPRNPKQNSAEQTEKAAQG